MNDHRAEQLEALLPAVLRRMFVDTEYDELLELPLAQLRILRAVMDQSRTASEVAEMLGYSLSGLSQLCQKLVSAGLLVKTKDEEDARVKHLSLSAKGQKLMEERRQARIAQAKRVLSRLPEEEQATFVRLLEKLSNATTSESWTVPLERITA